MELTKAKAKKLCLIKWKYAMETGCDGIELCNWLKENHKKIHDMFHHCGYCEYYRVIKNEFCYKCVLGMEGLSTCSRYYGKWADAKIKELRIEYATKIYKDIKRS